MSKSGITSSMQGSSPTGFCPIYKGLGGRCSWTFSTISSISWHSYLYEKAIEVLVKAKNSIVYKEKYPNIISNSNKKMDLYHFGFV